LLDADGFGLFRRQLQMALLDKLERTFGRLAIQNLTLYLVIGQVAFVLASMMQLVDPVRLVLWPIDVLEGEWWRLITFMFVVPVPAPNSLFGFVFLVFGWYLFYLMGNALEAHWGAFRYNVFLFTSYALTVALSFITPGAPVSNAFILGSVFIAFAYLNPDFELTLFFILPVKIKWLALISIAFGAYEFIVSGLPTRLQIGAAVVAFLLFFGRDILMGVRYRQRKAARQAARVAQEDTPRHVCYVCGKTDKTHPQLDFRYCSKCDGDQCYCPEHIQNHAHVVAANDGKPA
jgi:membrane associated rhomboid family serine protease